MTPGDEELRPPATVHRGGADGWVDCACGNRHWGLVGAAGVLVWRAVPSDGPGDGPGACGCGQSCYNKAWFVM